MELMHLSFFVLMMSFLSLWIHRSAWLWGGFLAISYIIAMKTSVVQPFSVVPLVTFAIVIWLLRQQLHAGMRWGLILLSVGLAAGLNFHSIPGFNNWHVSGGFWVNYDKPFIGLFPLAFVIPLLRTPQEWWKMGLKAIPLSIVGISIMAYLALSSETVDWQFKLPSHFILRIITNLFLVVIPEEGFFRGFLQEELYKRFGEGVKGTVGSLLSASAVFALFHLGWHSSLAMLGFVFLAGVLYGLIYRVTRSVESSIICHFALNFIHMTCFSYHAE